MTANEIRSIDDDAFLGLPELEELVIRENHISQLPGLPNTMTLIDGSHNDISSKGIHHEAFKVRTANLACLFRPTNGPIDRYLLFFRKWQACCTCTSPTTTSITFQCPYQRACDPYTYRYSDDATLRCSAHFAILLLLPRLERLNSFTLYCGCFPASSA